MRVVTFAVAMLAAACSSSAIAATSGWGVDLADQDRSVKPGDDFAMYENGAWYKRTTLTQRRPMPLIGATFGSQPASVSTRCWPT